jgi:hypothetical protein
MLDLTTLPTLQQAEEMLCEAQRKNPGPWVDHSRYTARAAERIAAAHPHLDPSAAYILGLLHDIGRREGVTAMRHTLDGYHYLNSMGFDAAAQICMTHSLPIRDVSAGAGAWDCSDEELDFVKQFIAGAEYTLYDALIQLCDSLALPTGCCLIEKRLVDVVLRHGFNGCTIEKWKAFLRIQEEFDQAIGRSIYTLLPEVMQNTFGVDLCGE